MLFFAHKVSRARRLVSIHFGRRFFSSFSYFAQICYLLIEKVFRQKLNEFALLQHRFSTTLLPRCLLLLSLARSHSPRVASEKCEYFPISFRLLFWPFYLCPLRRRRRVHFISAKCKIVCARETFPTLKRTCKSKFIYFLRSPVALFSLRSK